MLYYSLLGALPEEKKSHANLFLSTVDSGAVEKESTIASRGSAVAAFRGGEMAAARSVGIWERKKKGEKKREPRGRERREQEPPARTDGEKLWYKPKFYIPKNNVVQSKMWF
jgi:hypothetical protein